MNFIDLILTEAKRKGISLEPVLCTVKSGSVDTGAYTCTCAPVNGDAEISGVRIMPGDPQDTGLALIPKEGSYVIVEFLDKHNGYISMFSELESIQLHGIQYGGMVKIDELVKKLNALENAFKDLLNEYIAHTHPVSGALAKALTPPSILQPLTNTKVEDLENQKVTHG